MLSSPKRLYERWNNLTDRLGLTTVGRWLVLSILVGTVGGLGGILFNILYEACNSFFMEWICGYTPPLPGGEGGDAGLVPQSLPNNWVAIIPAIGGLLSGILVYKFAPEAEGHGTDAVIDAYHNKRGLIRARTPIIKMLASSLTIGSGGSAGREGPIAQIGAGFGSILGSLLRLSDRERRILVLAGVGAGIGSIFRAPLGGALFAAEVLYRDAEFEYEALIPAFVASIVGYSVYCPLSGAGWGSIFMLPAEGFRFAQPMALPLYFAMAAVLAVFGVIYVKAFYFSHHTLFKKMPVPQLTKPAIGGLFVGLIALFCPQILGMGYGYVQEAIDGSLPIKLMLLIAVGKIVATSLTVGSGGSGGVFAPSLVIGGLLGGAFGLLFQQWFGDTVVPQPGAFVLVGMAGFFAGAGKVPISSMLMVSEMTVGYGLLVPLMLVVAVSFLLSGERVTIYEKQVPRRVDSPAHLGDFIIDILETIRVRDVCSGQDEVQLVNENTPLEKVLQLTTQTTHSCYPVVNDDDELTGVLLLDDLRSAFFEPELFPLVIARDVAVASFPSIYLTDDLSDALRKLMESGSSELPVVNADQPKAVVGMLNRKDLIQSYHKRMSEYLTSREQARREML